MMEQELVLTGPDWSATFTHDHSWIFVALPKAATVAGATLSVYSTIVGPNGYTLGRALAKSWSIAAPPAPADALLWVMGHPLGDAFGQRLTFVLKPAVLTTPPGPVTLQVRATTNP